ncbi:hypothetical protein ACRRRY_004640 [Salmonella enterica subsp. enterica]
MHNSKVLDLIEKYSDATIVATVSIRGGNNQGTFAIEPLVYAYAR